MEDSYLDDIRDLLASLEKSLLQVEANSFDKELTEQIFRDMHTIKGASYMFDMKALGDFVHKVENIYDDLRNQKYLINEEIIQCSLHSLDFINQALKFENLEKAGLISKKEELLKQFEIAKSFTESEDVRDNSYVGPSIFLLIVTPKISFVQGDGHPLNFILEDLKEHPHEEYIHFKSKKEQTINKIKLLFPSEQTKAEIESLFLFIEEDVKILIEEFKIENKEKLKEPLAKYTPLLENKSGDHLIKDLKLSLCGIKDPQKEAKTSNKQEDPVQKSSKKDSEFIKVSRSKIDDLMSGVSELITMQATLKSEADKFQSETLYRLSESMELITENLRGTIFSVSLVKVETLEIRFQRLIKELTKDLGKKVEFITEGTDTEIDKKIIETLTDPLLHIIRNCLGHGIESPEEREAAGKNPVGKITLNSYYSGNHVIIEITDDGKGIDTEKIKAKAVEKEIIGREDNLNEDELINLIFHPGFSTSNIVNDVSGRGVGMDVVRKKIQEIRGEVIVNSEWEKGTKFTIKIPLSLSIIEGLLTKVGNSYFVLPLSTVREIHRLNKTEFTQLPEGSQIVSIEGKQLPVISLEKSFGLPDVGNLTTDIITVDVGINKKGLAVDQIEGQIKAVLKPLSEYYEDQEFVSGGTILGDGSLALILDIDQLITKN